MNKSVEHLIEQSVVNLPLTSREEEVLSEFFDINFKERLLGIKFSLVKIIGSKRDCDFQAPRYSLENKLINTVQITDSKFSDRLLLSW